MGSVGTEHSGVSDHELLERLRAGDERGVEELVDRYAGQVYRVALRITGRPEDAQEVTWKVMEMVWRTAVGFHGASRLSTWIYRLAANAADGAVKARPAPALPLEQIPAGNPGDWSALCEDPAVQSELRAVLKEAVAALPPDYRAAVVLRDIEGLSNTEVASILGESLAAVKSRVHRARLALRGRLSRYFDQRGRG